VVSFLEDSTRTLQIRRSTRRPQDVNYPEQVGAARAPLLPRLLVSLVGVVCRLPWLVLAIAAILVGLSLFAAFTRLDYRTSRNDLINPHKDCQRRWQSYLNEFGNDDDIVVVVEGTDRLRMEQALEAVAAEVRQRPDLFDRLFYEVDLRPLANRALLYLTVDDLQAIRDRLQEMRPLLELGPLGWRGLTVANLVREAEQRLRQMRPEDERAAADEPFWQQLLAVTRSATSSLDELGAYSNPWSSMIPRPADQPDLLAKPRYFFCADGSLAFLLVRPRMEGGSFTAARRSVDAMKGAVNAVRANFPDVQLGLTGMPVLETDEMVATQEDTTRAGWLALAGVALLYLVVYRCWRYPVLTVVTLLVGTAWALGWLTMTVGHLNILSATFAIMLIGMGDYGVLWVTRYEQERTAGVDVLAALRTTAAGVGPGIVTAAATTALAFYAAMLADFQAVIELGWIAGSGVLMCALACFTVLPAMLVISSRWSRVKQASTSTRSVSEGAWLPTLTQRPHGVVAAALALTALVGAGTFWVRYDHNLLHMQAHGLESVQWELKLIERTAGASWHALSYRSDREEVLALKERYEQLPEVSKVVEVASLVPPAQDEKLELMRAIRHRLRWLPERGSVLTPMSSDSAHLRQILVALQHRLQELAESASLFGDLASSVSELGQRLDRLASDAGAARLQQFDRRLATDLAENLHRLREAAEPEPILLSDIPAALRERYVSPSGHWLLRVFARDCLWDFEPLGQFVRQVQTVDRDATGRPFTTREGLAAMKSGFQWAAVYAFAAIVLVLLLDVRSVGHTLLALAPLAMGVLLSLGLMGLFGIPLNPANMIAFPLILGVGVDNGVHVLHDYLNRRPGKPYALSRSTGRGILVAALTTVLGFGTLMIARHRGQVGLGCTLALGVSCCMVASLVFLPALLRLLSMRRSTEAAVVPEPVPARLAA
jgi:uncharacterized protein